MVKGIEGNKHQRTNGIESKKEVPPSHPPDSTSKKTHWFIQALFRLFACFRKPTNNQSDIQLSRPITPFEKPKEIVTSLTEPLLPKGPDSVTCTINLEFAASEQEGELVELMVTNPGKKPRNIAGGSRRYLETSLPIKNRTKLERGCTISVILTENGEKKNLDSFEINDLTGLTTLFVNVSENNKVTFTETRVKKPL